MCLDLEKDMPKWKVWRWCEATFIKAIRQAVSPEAPLIRATCQANYGFPSAWNAGVGKGAFLVPGILVLVV